MDATVRAVKREMAFPFLTENMICCLVNTREKMVIVVDRERVLAVGDGQ
jgi:hypothetical protein